MEQSDCWEAAIPYVWLLENFSRKLNAVLAISQRANTNFGGDIHLLSWIAYLGGCFLDTLLLQVFHSNTRSRFWC